MANVELGLAIGFYFYPCGLIATLFLSQLARYRYKYAGSGPQVDEKGVDKIYRFYAKCVWTVQLALTPLLVRIPTNPTRDTDVFTCSLTGCRL